MKELVLEARDLCVRAQRRGLPAWPVQSVSFEVRRGECLGLVGESGAGKSLTLRATIGLLPPGTRLAGGTVRVAGRPYRRETGKPKIGMVFQEPKASLNPLMRVGDLIKEGLRVRGIRGAPAAPAALALLAEVDFDDPELRVRSFPHELSGGQRQRVAIAMALAAEPAVLLCDEPTTALDVMVQEQILKLLARVRAERDLALVFVSHDLSVIANVSSRVGVMYAGRVLEHGPTAEVLGAPAHPYTASLIASLPRIDSGVPVSAIPGERPRPERWPTGCRFHPRCSYAQPDCASADYELADCGADHKTACIHWRLLAQHLRQGCA
jgi:oligopeptide/dipeptide ABC transporter ATP-binding protein